VKTVASQSGPGCALFSLFSFELLYMNSEFSIACSVFGLGEVKKIELFQTSLSLPNHMTQRIFIT
jgi:hypothetical protein